MGILDKFQLNNKIALVTGQKFTAYTCDFSNRWRNPEDFVGRIVFLYSDGTLIF